MVGTADVVVVGGGVVGASAAFRCAQAGLDVVLLERGEPAGGSSGKPVGGVRAQFSGTTNVALAARSLAAYHRFAAEMGADVGLRRTGYLFALRTAAHVEAFRRAAVVQHAHGVPSRLLGPAEAARRGVVLREEALEGAAWSPDDGVARPRAVVAAYLAGATALGARVRRGCALLGAEGLPGGRARLRTTGGDVETPAVVVAAGAWSAGVGRLLGVDLPVRPVRRQIAFAPPAATAALGLPVPPEALPFTIDQTSCAYWHGDGEGGLLLGWADPDQAEGEDVTVDDGWHAGLRAALAEVAPALAGLPLERGWAGLYEVTPDRDAALGPARGGLADDGVRVVAATGFSGHGFLMAPAVGEVVRDLVTGRPPVVDVAELSPDRFVDADAAVRTEVAIV